MEKSFYQKQYSKTDFKQLELPEEVKYYYDRFVVYQSSAVLCFLAVAVIIAIAAVLESLFYVTNGFIVGVVVTLFTILSMGFLGLFIFYKNKTLEILKQKEVLEN